MGIGTDVISVFPGEDEASFRRTIEFVRSLPLTYFHVFSFSRRPGTPAASMENQVDPDTRKARSRKLIKLGNSKKRDFMRSLTGTRELAVIQGKAEAVFTILHRSDGQLLRSKCKLPFIV